MTDQQLNDLERLLKELDEERAAFDAFLARAKKGGESVNFGPTAKEYRRLCEAHRAARWRYEAALVEAGPALVAEVRRLQGVIAQHDLCHDLHGRVGAGDFARGCAAEQRRLYGCAPDADEVRRLRASLREMVNGFRGCCRFCEADDPCKRCWEVLGRANNLLGDNP